MNASTDPPFALANAVAIADVGLDGLPLALANGIGVVGVVLIVGWLVWSGRLVPKSTHDAHVKLLTERLADEIHEKGEWRTESRIKDQQVLELTEQNTKMLSGFDALADFLQGLRRAGIGAQSKERVEP